MEVNIAVLGFIDKIPYYLFYAQDNRRGEATPLFPKHVNGSTSGNMAFFFMATANLDEAFVGTEFLVV